MDIKNLDLDILEKYILSYKKKVAMGDSKADLILNKLELEKRSRKKPKPERGIPSESKKKLKDQKVSLIDKLYFFSFGICKLIFFPLVLISILTLIASSGYLFYQFLPKQHDKISVTYETPIKMIDGTKAVNHSEISDGKFSPIDPYQVFQNKYRQTLMEILKEYKTDDYYDDISKHIYEYISEPYLEEYFSSLISYAKHSKEENGFITVFDRHHKLFLNEVSLREEELQVDHTEITLQVIGGSILAMILMIIFPLFLMIEKNTRVNVLSSS